MINKLLKEAVNFDPAKAQHMAEYRATHGAFSSPAESQWRRPEEDNEQDERLTKHYQEHYDSVTGTHDNTHAIADNVKYTNPYYNYTRGSRELNTHLVKAHKGELPTEYVEAPFEKEKRGRYEVHAKALDAAIRTAPALPEHVVSLSGLGENRGKKIQNLKPGDEVHFPAYTSTSVKHYKGFHFGHKDFFKPDPDSNEVRSVHDVAVFHVPQGSKGVVHLGFNSDYGTEGELLLHAGARAIYSHTTEYSHESSEVNMSFGAKKRKAIIRCHHFQYQQPDWA